MFKDIEIKDLVDTPPPLITGSRVVIKWYELAIVKGKQMRRNHTHILDYFEGQSLSDIAKLVGKEVVTLSEKLEKTPPEES